MRSLSLLVVVVALALFGSGRLFACHTMPAQMTAAVTLNTCADVLPPAVQTPTVVPQRMPEKLPDANPDTVADCRPGLFNRVFHPFGGRFAPRFTRGGGCGCG